MGFWGDERGQPVQIGFILLFGILVVVFAGYQGYVVPNQNAQVEFQHSQEATQEMQTFREDFLGAAADGDRFSAGFTLGTDYQPRLLALNPPPTSGKLQTEQPGDGRFYMNTGDESLAEICGVEQDGDGAVPSNALVYQPSYNEYQNSPRVVYENTVTYNRFTQNDAVTLTTDQTIIQGTDIMIPPLVGDVSEDGTERHTVDLYPGKAGVGEASGSNLTLTVPTELGVGQWEKLLEDEMEDGNVQSVNPNGSSVDIVLEDGSYDITCPVIGVGDKPDNEPTQVRGGGNEINPAAPGDVQLIGAEWSGDAVTLTFRNSAGNNSFTQGRINFYDDSTGGSQDGLAELNAVGDTDNPRSENWNIGGNYESIEPTIQLEGDGATTSIEYVFEDNPNEQNHWFVTTLTLGSGEQATYFVGGSFSPDDSDSADGGSGGDGGAGLPT